MALKKKKNEDKDPLAAYPELAKAFSSMRDWLEKKKFPGHTQHKQSLYEANKWLINILCTDVTEHIQPEIVFSFYYAVLYTLYDKYVAVVPQDIVTISAFEAAEKLRMDKQEDAHIRAITIMGAVLQALKAMGGDGTGSLAPLHTAAWLKFLVTLLEATRGSELGGGDFANSISDILVEIARDTVLSTGRALLIEDEVLGFKRLGSFIFASNSAATTMNLFRMLITLAPDGKEARLAAYERALKHHKGWRGTNADTLFKMIKDEGRKESSFAPGTYNEQGVESSSTLSLERIRNFQRQTTPSLDYIVFTFHTAGRGDRPDVPFQLGVDMQGANAFEQRVKAVLGTAVTAKRIVSPDKPRQHLKSAGAATQEKVAARKTDRGRHTAAPKEAVTVEELTPARDNSSVADLGDPEEPTEPPIIDSEDEATPRATGKPNGKTTVGKPARAIELTSTPSQAPAPSDLAVDAAFDHAATAVQRGQLEPPRQRPTAARPSAADSTTDHANRATIMALPSSPQAKPRNKRAANTKAAAKQALAAKPSNLLQYEDLPPAIALPWDNAGKAAVSGKSRANELPKMDDSRSTVTAKGKLKATQPPADVEALDLPVVEPGPEDVFGADVEFRISIEEDPVKHLKPPPAKSKSKSPQVESNESKTKRNLDDCFHRAADIASEQLGKRIETVSRQRAIAQRTMGMAMAERAATLHNEGAAALNRVAEAQANEDAEFDILKHAVPSIYAQIINPMSDAIEAALEAAARPRPIPKLVWDA
ncbi:hypothetical protein Q5752_004961 [Cryptotrichosporon argae]